ncbi:hypothetical protein [Chromobacterium amazonense]|uniref:hypothetical protein n=1 Tax=Chromobacterium amazonense TaxID=1382803 RepID=UPI003F7915E0
MKRMLVAAALAACALAAALPVRADVGVSVHIGEPGFYGQINIGGAPAPQLVYPQPVIIQPVPVAAPPIYLRVPPEHMRHWDRYCRQYHACNHRVYFVRDEWYRQVYVPHYHARYSMPPHDHYDHHEYHEAWHGDHDRRDWYQR